MSTRRMSNQPRIASTPAHSGVARSRALVPVASHARPGARPPAPDEDALVAARRESVDPLWMITGAIGLLFALLALAVAF